MVKKRYCKWIWIPLIILSVITLIESKKRYKRGFSVSHNYQQNQHYIISKENHQDLTSNTILIPNQKSSNVNAFEETITMTATTSLYDVNKIVKKKTLLDLEKPMLFNDINFDLNELSNETHIRVKRIDSEFDNHQHKSLIHLRNNYLEDLANSFPRKSSNDINQYYNTSNHQKIYSNSNETIVNNHITETNHYFNNFINDDEGGKFEKDDLIISNHTEMNKTRFKRENKPNKNARRRIGHGKKRKMKKHSGGKGKKKGNSFKGTNKRHPNSLKMMSPFKSKRTNHTIGNNSSKINNDYNKIESKIENEVSIKDNQLKINDTFDEKETDDNKRSSREKNEQIEEKTLINENKDAIVNDSVRDKRSLHKKDDILFRKRGMIASWATKNGKFRTKRNGSKDLIIPNYPNVFETSSSLSILSDNQMLNEKPRADRAVESIEEIKELAEKLVTKVNELQNYLGYENKKSSNEEELKKKKLESREIEVGNNKTVDDEEEVVLETPKLVDECVRIGDLSSALKTLDDKKNASIDKIAMKEEEESDNGRFNLSNDKTDKRIVRKNRIKRKSRRKWGRWTGWSSCSVTCGKGRQIRWRHCLRDCSTVETEMEEKACQMPACPPGKFLGIF